MPVRTKPTVVVLGGGFGGLEAAFYLRWRLGARAHITLLSERDRFLFKPNTIYVPFGLDPERLTIPLDRPTRRRGIEFAPVAAREVNPTAQMVLTDDRAFHYDYLVVATGAGMRPAEIPGLSEHAETIWSPEAMLQLRTAFARLLADGREGVPRRALFLVPPNNKCAGPLYELVLMVDTWLRRNGGRKTIDLTWATFESGYVQAFGPRLHHVVTGEFARRGITGHPGLAVDRVEPGEARFQGGQTLPFDLLVTFPPYVAATVFATLPRDERGFIQTDLRTRQVLDHPNVYAVGDASDFPVKQAFLALLQADAAAEHVAARVLGVRPGPLFDPVSMCVMEEFDTATFAQVPLCLTGRPERPVQVRPGAEALYRVGTSPAWRLGKKLLGLYLPWRFGAGLPFHAGVPWKAMELGLKVMGKALAA